MYAIQLESNRLGEFEFNTETQDNTFPTLGKAKAYAKTIYRDHCDNYDPPLTLQESKKDLGKVAIYLLEKV